jgi:peptide/nickel transport system permease protein
VLVLAVACFAPLLVPADPIRQNLLAALQEPSAAHPLGLDHLGRDVLARLAHGAGRSLGLAGLAVIIAFGAGVALGLVAAASGPVVDGVIMRVADVALAFPGLLLALLLAGLTGGGIVPLVVGLSLTAWPPYARMARAVAAGTWRETHVEAARLAGFPRRVILARHVLPPVLAQTVPLATLGLGGAVVAISSLGFLGLGLQPPTPEWGAMIAELLPTMTEAPVQLAAPCLALFVSVLGFTLTGRAIVDAANRREIST